MDSKPKGMNVSNTMQLSLINDSLVRPVDMSVKERIGVIRKGFFH